MRKEWKKRKNPYRRLHDKKRAASQSLRTLEAKFTLLRVDEMQHEKFQRDTAIYLSERTGRETKRLGWIV